MQQLPKKGCEKNGVDQELEMSQNLWVPKKMGPENWANLLNPLVNRHFPNIKWSF